MEGGWILHEEMVHDLHYSEYFTGDKNESTSEVYIDFLGET